MDSQIKLGRIFGVRVGLHWSWFVIALLIAISMSERLHTINASWSNAVVWSSATVTALLFFAALFAHELAHAFVARSRKLHVNQITLFALGGVTHIENEATDPGTEFWIGIAGPIMSLCIGFALLGIARFSGASSLNAANPGLAILLWLGYINIALAVFNMIPGFPLDGGRVLRATLWHITGNKKRSTRIAALAGQSVGFVLLLAGIFRVFTGSGFDGVWLTFVGWFLWQAARSSYAILQAETLLQNLHVEDLMSHDCVSLDSAGSLQQFVDEQLPQAGEHCFMVTENGLVTGIITPKEIRAIKRERWATTRLRDAMQPMGKVLSIAPESSALQAIEIMAHENVTQLPVISGGHVEGTISRGSILHVIHAHPEWEQTEAA